MKQTYNVGYIQTPSVTHLANVKQSLADAGLVSPTTPNEMLPTAIEEGMKSFIKPNGTLDITENGTYDVTDKASVNVNVAGNGVSLNIHYGLEAPEDTSMLWVKLENEPSKVEISNNVEGGNDQIKLSKYTLPTNLGSMVCETVGDKIYIMSGAVGSDDYVNTIYMFDPKNGSFTTKSSTFSNSEGASHSSAVVDKYIYILSWDANGKYVFKYDTEMDTWTKSSKLGNDFWDRSATAVGSKIYLFGGYYWKYASSTKYTNTVLVYDTTTDLSTTLSVTLPASVSSVCSAAVGTKIYLFHKSFSTVYVFDTVSTELYSLDIALPATTDIYESVAIGNDIYVLYAQNVYKFDTITKNFSLIGQITNSINASYGRRGCCAYNNSIYTFGGSSSNLIYTLETKYQVDSNTLILLNAQEQPKMNISTSPNTIINIGLSKVILGNSENIGEEVEFKIHNGIEWS